MSDIELNNLLDYILSLGLTREERQWLADRLLESITDEEEPAGKS